MSTKLWKQLQLPQLSKFKRPSKSRIATILFAVFIVQQLRRLVGPRSGSSSNKSKMAPPSIPGFTALSDQIFLREPESLPPPGCKHPDVVMVYGWGDGLPKHVAKFTDGYRVLYPHAKQIVVLGPISKAMFTDHQVRSESMMPIARAIWPEGPGAPGSGPEPRILAHSMSNTGAVNYASFLNIFQQTYGRPLPHSLSVLDSTPGSTDFTWPNLQRWSRAMALGTAAWFPWPFVMTQTIWAFFLTVSQVIGVLRRSENAGAWSRRSSHDTNHLSKSVRRLYMYSKEDDLIGYEDIEAHVAEGRRLGWQADVAIFEGSGHVEHMRKFGDKYWKAIMDSWERAVAETPVEGS